MGAPVYCSSCSIDRPWAEMPIRIRVEKSVVFVCVHCCARHSRGLHDKALKEMGIVVDMLIDSVEWFMRGWQLFTTAGGRAIFVSPDIADALRAMTDAAARCRAVRPR